MVNEARLFKNELKTEDQLSVPKIINILVEFGRKMEAILVEMRKLVLKLQLEPFRMPISSPKGPLSINRTPQQHRLSKEPVSEVKRIATPAPVVQMKAKVVEKESETSKTKSSDPSLRRVSIRKKKEPTLKSSTETEEEGSSKDIEEVEVEDSNKEPELEEEEEEEVEPKLETPPLEKTRIKTRTSRRHKATLIVKTQVSTKRPAKEKTPNKGESS